ncbi:MAG TPA: metalloregulator ArsR/SmtB family transcription factor [Gemmatimonadaceae bacterium]|nr:metalloregulator ArsR/SmtB family transcription factor [Gemmatimonadaceae bacterium]
MLLDGTLLATIASPRRREILRILWTDERSAGDVHRALPDVSFPAVSLQLRALAEAGLVTVRAEGRQRWYRAQPEVLGPAREMLESMWSDALWRLKLAAELEATRRGPRPRSKHRRRRPRTAPPRKART